PVGGSVQVFDGLRSLDTAADSEFSLSASSLSPDLYRLTYTAGTDPSFRTDRDIDLTGVDLTLAYTPNGVLTVTASTTPFADVEVGDEVMVAGALTGDPSSPFSILNQGRWTVLNQSDGTLT